MTIEEMKDMMYVNTSPTSGRFSEDMTDKQWQSKFLLMKSIVEPCKDDDKLHCKENRQKEGEKYDGETVYQRYCRYINDVLDQIRLGHHDYCYYCYQVRDLLRFEHNRLRTKYHPDGQYVEVWLER